LIFNLATVPEPKPAVSLKRKASEMTPTSAGIKKIRPIPKVDFYIYLSI